jgi:hypothetical protein
MQELCEASELVMSAVTASNTLAVAQEAARFLPPRQRLPRPELRVARHQAAGRGAGRRAGAHYVEAGVMTSVPPYGIKVPMLLGGARAVELAELLTWGMDARPSARSWASPARSRCAAA